MCVWRRWIESQKKLRVDVKTRCKRVSWPYRKLLMKYIKCCLKWTLREEKLKRNYEYCLKQLYENQNKRGFIEVFSKIIIGLIKIFPNLRNKLITKIVSIGIYCSKLHPNLGFLSEFNWTKNYIYLAIHWTFYHTDAKSMNSHWLHHLVALEHKKLMMTRAEKMTASLHLFIWW